MVCALITVLSMQSNKIHIGNYLVTHPNALAFIVDDRAAVVLDPGGEYFAGLAAPDDTYHLTKISLAGANVRFEWGRVGDAVVGRLSSDRAVSLPINFVDKMWPDFHCAVAASADGATADVGGQHWALRTQIPVTPSSMVAGLEAEKPQRFVAGFGKLPSLSSVDSTLSKAAATYTSRRSQAEGDWGDFIGAISDNLNNNRIYSSDDKRVAITVARRWSPDANGAPYFCWDSFFNGDLACLDDLKTARETVRAILSWQTPEGLVPNFGHWKFENSRLSEDRSQPPVGSMCIWKMHQRRPDRAFLEETYPKLLKWHRWWPTARDGQHDGLLEWGSSRVGKQGALWETGWDDTVQFEGAEMVGQTLNAYAVDLNSLWVMDAEYLAYIADALGHHQDARDLREERAKTIKLMNEKLWNPDLGTYCSRMWDGNFLTRLTPMNFYPMIAGVPDAKQAKSMIAVMKDPKRFWGSYVLPTVAFDDPVYPQQDYWRGKVWGPVNYLVFQGLLRYASPETLNEFADKSVNLFMRNWKQYGVCGENYLSTTGRQSSDPHYTWGALLCLLGLENVCMQLPDGRIRLNGTQNLTIDIKNIPIADSTYDIKTRPGHAELIRDGRTVLKAEGEVVVAGL